MISFKELGWWPNLRGLIVLFERPPTHLIFMSIMLEFNNQDKMLV